MNIPALLNDNETDSTPKKVEMSISNLINDMTVHEDGEWIWTEVNQVWKQVWAPLRHVTNHLHDKTPSTKTSLNNINGPLDGSKLVQKTHLRSTYGPDYPYLSEWYPNMDGLCYRMVNPVEGQVQHNQQNAAVGQVVNYGSRPTYVEAAAEETQEASEYWRYTLPPISYQVIETHHDGFQAPPYKAPSNKCDEFVSNASQHRQYSVFNQSLPQTTFTTAQYQRQYTGPNQVRPVAAMNFLTLPSSQSATHFYQPNGYGHMQGGSSSLRCEDSFINTPLASPIEEITVSKCTGIDDPINIKANKKRKLEQISASLDDFQLPFELREGHIIDPITGRERKRRPTDGFPLSPGQELNEKQRLKCIYAQERGEREECNDSHSDSSSVSLKDRTPKCCPPGCKIGHFTEKVRKLRAFEGRPVLRRRYYRMVERPVEEREWEILGKGDGEIELTEWEKVNKKPARMKRAQKAFRRMIRPS